MAICIARAPERLLVETRVEPAQSEAVPSPGTRAFAVSGELPSVSPGRSMVRIRPCDLSSGSTRIRMNAHAAGCSTWDAGITINGWSLNVARSFP